MEMAITDHNSIIVYTGYEVYQDQVNTEQRVLAWVYHLCDKQGMDISKIKKFIDCCTTIHPTLDVLSKGD